MGLSRPEQDRPRARAARREAPRAGDARRSPSGPARRANSGQQLSGHTADADRAEVERLLGRRPQGQFEVVLRHRDGSPLVIRNAPLLDDGTPMPTRYWLVGEPERTEVSRLENEGGVARAEAEVPPAALAAAHARYAAERDAAMPPAHRGPRPSGGVGGTRRGVKCLHAHYAWYLVGGDDPVGRWVHDRLAAGGAQRDRR